MSEQQPHDHPAEPPRDRPAAPAQPPPPPPPPARRRPAPGGDTEAVEPWALADEVLRLPFGAWRMAIIAWIDIAKGVAATTPPWLGAACLIALAAVRDLSARQITAWPPYVAVLGILLIAIWAGPSPPAAHDRRTQRARRARRRLLSRHRRRPDAPAEPPDRR